MDRLRIYILTMLVCLIAAASATAQLRGRLSVDHADYSEIVFSNVKGQPDTLYYGGSVIVRTETGMAYCDTLIIAIGHSALFHGAVRIEETDYRLVADDSVRYDLLTAKARAYGDYVQLFSATDSIMAVGTNAFYDRERKYFYMTERPTVYLNYPDTAAMIEVIGDIVQYDALNKSAEAEGNVKVSTDNVNSTSECAILHPQSKSLDLYGSPHVHRERSHISGQFISLAFGSENVERVDVIDSAYAEFEEPKDSAESQFDRSILSGKRIVLGFDAGELAWAVCRTQAYAWYYPYAPEGQEQVQNEVSGDSILFSVQGEALKRVDVVGGAAGRYQNTRYEQNDSTTVAVTDTIDYRGHELAYDLEEGMITLQSEAEAQSGTMHLSAYRVEFDTDSMIVEAFAGEMPVDSALQDSLFLPELRVAKVPVVLMDASDTLYGNYLEYSIDTEKGRIETSETADETGKFYGQTLYRQNRDVYYMENARFTTCDLEGSSFYASRVKLVEGKRLIAKPVVMYIKRLPMLAIPFYVFPLEKGRHSGILQFTIGNIERGERYIENVGYYWAASQYWDLQGALDYYEEPEKLNFYGKLNYSKLYSFNGSISGNYGRRTTYNRNYAEELSSTSWTIKGNHTHEITPTLKLTGDGEYVSDSRYYLDYSTDPAERLNRTIISKLSITKKFGNGISTTAKFSHSDNLDSKTRTDNLPNISASLPTLYPFGSSSTNDEGEKVTNWYNNVTVRYTPSMTNYSTRSTNEEYVNLVSDTIADTSYVVTIIDSVTSDTTYTVDTTIDTLSIDTLDFRTRKGYARIDHDIRLSSTFKIAKYFNFIPNATYNESWIKIHKTDQAADAGIDASTTYRTYKFSMGANLNTKLYGIVRPNVLGLMGLRQVISPSVGYAFTPESDRHPKVNAYAGGARSTSRSQSVNFGINHDYDAKVAAGGVEKTVNLLSIKHSVGYDFEKDKRRWTDIGTTFSSRLVPQLTFNGSATHSIYKKDSDDLDWRHPRLTMFRLNLTLPLRGQSFLFDEPATVSIPRGVDSSSQLAQQAGAGQSESPKGWNANVSWGYSESNIGTDSYYRSSFLTLSLSFYLTPVTRVSYSQSYNFVDQKTVANEVRIERALHCWTGKFWWRPTGSTRGWGFTIFMTGLPAIKIDQNEGTVSSSNFLSSLR